MPDWTKTNFQRLPDRSPAGSPMEWRLAREAARSPELGVSRFTYGPGARMPFGHRHREQEELYVVAGGSGRAKIGMPTDGSTPASLRTLLELSGVTEAELREYLASKGWLAIGAPWTARSLEPFVAPSLCVARIAAAG